MPPAPATTSAQAMQNLQGFQSSMQSPDQIASGTEQSLGIPGAQQQVSGLRQAITNTTNLLNNVAPSVMGRTASSLVTSAQANRQIANEEAPISKTLADQTSKGGQAESDLQALLGKAGNLESLKETSQNDQLTNLKDIYTALYGKEQDATKLAEQVREANQTNSLEQQKLAASQNSGGLTPNEALTQADKYQLGYKANNAGYAFKGPNGATSMYDYVANVNNGDPGATYNAMKSLLQKSPSQYDKNAFNTMTALEAAGHNQTDIMQRLSQQYGQLF